MSKGFLDETDEKTIISEDATYEYEKVAEEMGELNERFERFVSKSQHDDMARQNNVDTLENANNQLLEKIASLKLQMNDFQKTMKDKIATEKSKSDMLASEIQKLKEFERMSKENTEKTMVLIKEIDQMESTKESIDSEIYEINRENKAHLDECEKSMSKLKRNGEAKVNEIKKSWEKHDDKEMGRIEDEIKKKWVDSTKEFTSRRVIAQNQLDAASKLFDESTSRSSVIKMQVEEVSTNNKIKENLLKNCEEESVKLKQTVKSSILLYNKIVRETESLEAEKLQLLSEIDEYEKLLKLQEQRIGLPSPEKRRREKQAQGDMGLIVSPTPRKKTRGSTETGSVIVDTILLESGNVTITNKSEDTIPLNGWTLVAKSSDYIYSFGKNVKIGPKESITIWNERRNKKHHKPPRDLYWTDDSVWNEEGDTAILTDNNGFVVDKLTVEGKQNLANQTPPASSAKKKRKTK